MLALGLSEGESIALDERMIGFLGLLFVASLQFSFGRLLSVGLPVALDFASPFLILFLWHQDWAGHLSIDAVTAVNVRQGSG